jgi:hypothetical protein
MRIGRVADTERERERERYEAFPLEYAGMIAKMP